MFEKISGFFKQFTQRRKRQSGETTIMESKEPGADEFGLDGDFADMDTFGDTAGAADSDDFVETAEIADTGGISDFDLEDSDGGMGGMSDEFEAEPRVEDEFSDFDITGADADISTGGTDFDERTVSDEISGETGSDFGDAFAVGEEGPSFEGVEEEAKGASPVKRILITVIAFVVAVGVGAAFQIFAWPSVSKTVGLAPTDEVKVDPQIQLTMVTKEEKRLTKELAEFKKVGAPEQVKQLKVQIAETRETQGALEEFKAEFAVVKEKEAAYDALLKQIATQEGNIKKTESEIENVRSEIERAKQRVIELARQTEEEYERFSFELARAELGQRLLIELQIQDIASFKEDVVELENRLTKLSAAALISTAVEPTSSEEAPTVETSEN